MKYTIAFIFLLILPITVSATPVLPCIDDAQEAFLKNMTSDPALFLSIFQKTCDLQANLSVNYYDKNQVYQATANLTQNLTDQVNYFQNVTDNIEPRFNKINDNITQQISDFKNGLNESSMIFSSLQYIMSTISTPTTATDVRVDSLVDRMNTLELKVDDTRNQVTVIQNKNDTPQYIIQPPLEQKQDYTLITALIAVIIVAAVVFFFKKDQIIPQKPIRRGPIVREFHSSQDDPDENDDADEDEEHFQSMAKLMNNEIKKTRSTADQKKGSGLKKVIESFEKEKENSKQQRR